ncbi:sarcinarray family protein [Methanococcoides vulcani]|uniref:Sarcinarray family protein n=1 Tax=Methanococcoides vulcani TaxID=1353158 RepID=A0A1H9Y1H6_9EURY|nr:sarcinarray family MAST domain-containing protein [Methanococcoides vulcani]SES62112.1 sarcinarray family protein [Methanococcoides vulcani]
MKAIRLFIAVNLVLLLSPLVAVAESTYGNIDVYYNGELYPNSEVPKPILKIGEPFTLRIELTVFQTSFVNVVLTELGDDDFVILEGPTNKMGEYTGLITLQENSTQIYEWKIAPTEKWADGTMPIDLHYEILDPSSPEPIVSSTFTAVLPYISTEYYDAPEITPAEPPETDTNQTPAFTLPATLLAIALVALRKKC